MGAAMNDELRRLFHELADLPPADREKALAERGIRADIRSELEDLLGFDASNTANLTDCVSGVARELLAGTPGRTAGSCGQYRLDRLLGRGGMGSVYLAERADGEIQQSVAVKVLRADSEGPDWHDRFLNERQILATLNQPSIVHVIDAGHTDDGRPYLVMEYVEGKPIDEYANGIGLRAKLALFLAVCDGVSHAHRRLIIHRDLKPSNIIVDSSGRPKLLDFGIAKLLDASGNDTQTLERFMTPGYASPEQLRGAVQSTATDVYSLGSVLYKLLTGHTPRESNHTALVAGEVVPPKRWNPDLPADLDSILRKSLRDEPEERYASVDALAGDIRAFLESRPVEARSGSNWYRMRKFLRHYWVPVSAAALVIASLATGLWIADRERALAQRRFLQVRRLAHTFVFELHDDVAKLEGSTKIRETMVRTGLEYLDNLAKEARGDKDLQNEIAAAYTKIGDAQGYPTKPNLGRIDDALTSYRKAGEIYRRLAVGDERYLGDLAAFYLKFAGLVRYNHDATKARELSESAIHTFDRVRANRQFNPQMEYSYIGAWCTVGDIDEDQGRYRQAWSEFTHCGELARAQLAGRRDAQMLSAASMADERIGTAAQELGFLGEALRAFDEDEKLLGELIAAEPRNPRWHRAEAVLYQFRSRVYDDDRYPNLGDPARALESARRYLAEAEAMVKHDPNDTSARSSRGVAMYRVSFSLREFDPAAAVQMARDSVHAFDELIASGKTNKLVEADRAQAFQRLAEAQWKAGRVTEARSSAETALAGRRLIATSATAGFEERANLVRSLVLAGRTNAAAGDFERAGNLLQEALDAAKSGADRQELTNVIPLALTEEALGTFYAGRRRAAEARDCYQRMVQLWQQFPDANEYVDRQKAAAERSLASLR